MNISNIIKNNDFQNLFFEGNFGIEKEGLRTVENEKLAMTDHPDTLGGRLYHPYIQTDFSESQPELVTPVQPGLKEALNWLEALHDVLFRSLPSNEYIWPYSMPNIFPDEEDIPLIRYNDPDAIAYREILSERYGKKKQTISGIHFNFSFSEDFIEALYKNQQEYKTKMAFQNFIYTKLAANFLANEWILLYLFGASPYANPDFFDSKSGRDLAKPEGYVRSLRNSSFGYHNHDDVIVSYESVEKYIEDIEYYVETDHLSEEREFYGNARLRGKGKALREMLSSGVQYIEFRSIDINPLEKEGLSYEQSLFYHLFFMLMVWMDKQATTEDIIKGQERNLRTSDESPFEKSQFLSEGLDLLKQMTDMLVAINADEEYLELIEKAVSKFEQPETTLSARIATLIDEKGYLDHGRELGLAYKEDAVSHAYRLSGFEDMELSTQLLIAEALQIGLEVEVLDRADQIVKLSHDGHTEYVRNGNMTSKDTTISHFIMENKTVTKKILAEHGFAVPKGSEYSSLEEALSNYSKYANLAMVVKPKSTNYGLGISVFKNPPTQEKFKEALEIAFKEDEAVLVEEFVEGTEYRFYVLDGKVGAVLLRVPANVQGDGQSTIDELIDQKNQDPLRGEKHRTPLGTIQKGAIEALMLKEQGYEFTSVPKNGEVVYLRENSNISTGGDSIDFTDDMHPSYHAIAVGIAEALEVNVTGIDLIIPDYQLPSTSDAPGYSCIEANFNPAISMHTFVTKGKGRRLAKDVIILLFPELFA